MNDYKTLIENRIKEFEKNRLWDKDVLDDLPAKPLLPNKIDYLNEKLSTKIKTKFFNWLALNYYENLIKKGDFVIGIIKTIMYAIIHSTITLFAFAMPSASLTT